MGNHILCTPCPLVPPLEKEAMSPGPCRRRRSPLTSRSTSLPTFGGGGRLEWRTPVRQLEDSCHQRTATHTKGSFLSSGNDLLYSRLGLVTTSSLQVLPVPRNTSHLTQPRKSVGDRLPLPITCLTKPSTCQTPHSSSFLLLERLSCPQAQRRVGLEPKDLPSLLHTHPHTHRPRWWRR